MGYAIEWDDAAARSRLIDRIGPAEYNKAFAEHVKASTVATVNGYPIRPISTGFGRLFQVYGTKKAFRTLAEAEAYAKNPVDG